MTGKFDLILNAVSQGFREPTRSFQNLETPQPNPDTLLELANALSGAFGLSVQNITPSTRIEGFDRSTLSRAIEAAFGFQRDFEIGEANIVDDLVEKIEARL